MDEIIVCRSNEEEYEDFLAAKCPCGSIRYGEQCLEIYDYISHPMFWCDDCGGRFFLDCEPYKEVLYQFEWDGEFDFSKYPIAGKTEEIFPKVKEPKGATCYRVPLCFVKKVSGSNMNEVRAKTPLSLEAMNELYEKGVI